MKGQGEDTKYQIRLSNLERSDFEEPRPYNKWETIWINKNWKLRFCVSRTASNFTEIGELVCMLVSTDGRKLRLKEKDFTKNDFLK